MQSNFITSVVRNKYRDSAPEVIKPVFLLWLLAYEYLDHDSELHDVSIKGVEKFPGL